MGNQSSTLSAVVTDRNTWQGRANNAWGSSRVWNSGTSWESAYTSEVTLYNNEVAAYNASQASLATMTSDRDTWQSRANSAYGASRVWGSGEAWETAYNRVLPPASPQALSGSSFAISITGYWFIYAHASTQSNFTVGGCVVGIDKNGVRQATNNPQGNPADTSVAWLGFCNAGDSITVIATGAQTFGGTALAYFVPTAANAH